MTQKPISPCAYINHHNSSSEYEGGKQEAMGNAMGNVCIGNALSLLPSSNACSFLCSTLCNQNKLTAVGRKRTFKWRIEGFSSLHEVQAKSYTSRPFEFGGYSWSLKIEPMRIDKKTGKECIGLFLELKDAPSVPSYLVVNTVFELCIYDQLRSYHQKRKAECYFRNEHPGFGFLNMISLESFKNSTSGFLVNDNCNFSVKFFKVCPQKVDCSGMFEFLSLTIEPVSNTFTWRIEKFSELQRPETSSRNFVAGGHKWNLKLYPDGKKNKSSLGLFLELHTTSTLPFKSKLHAKLSLCLLDQINGKHKKFSATGTFDEKAPSHGLDEFLSLDDIQDPTKGFLVDNGCIIEASVLVLGSSSRP